MTDGFFADAERIAGRSKDFDAFAERAGKVADALRTTLESTGKAWGDDAVGESFEAVHGDAARSVLDAVAGLRGELTEVGAKFADAAAAYREAEYGGQTDIGGVARTLEEG
ncbi:MAG: hypothetical protein GEU86_09510 [Actinophytocola sp.]|nr:hypothetical protein [Actinophytocola sp.]